MVEEGSGGGRWALSSFFPPFLREWSVPIATGRVIKEQMATPSFQCLPRWLPPLPCSDIKEPPHVTGGARPREPGVYCPSSQGCPGEIFFLAKPNEDGKRVSPGGEGLSITEWKFWELPGDPESRAEATSVIPFLPPPHPTPSESYSIAGSEGSISASAASGLAAPSGPSSGLSSGPCSPGPPRPVSGLRRWLDHSKHCLSVETEADSGRAGPYEVSREHHRSMEDIHEERWERVGWVPLVMGRHSYCP